MLLAGRFRPATPSTDVPRGNVQLRSQPSIFSHHYHNLLPLHNHLLLLLVCLLLPLLPQHTSASGYFQLQVADFNNSRATHADGSPCQNRGRSRNETSRRDRNCRTFFTLCLKEYQTEVTPVGACSFGQVASDVLGGNYFQFSQDDKTSVLNLRFDFAWTTSYTLILEARDRIDNSTDKGQLIERVSHRGILVPGQKWHTFSHNGNVASITHRVRVVCHAYYYNTTCTKFCRPRHDRFGHYTCTEHGEKACMDGWTGEDCTTPICLSGCHDVHGSCDKPGVCNCEFGWQGPLCDLCIPYPGCLHGSCSKAWTCECVQNWGGILCDKDLNYCGTHQPCLNNGICQNEKPNEYSCVCTDGFTGRNCERSSALQVNNECSMNPCLNGGSCLLHLGKLSCVCRSGWTGSRCDQDIKDCVGQCQNGATCLDLLNGYKCLCSSGFVGLHCETNLNKCQSNPCQNGGMCIDEANGFRCECASGYFGQLCQKTMNLCVPDPCLNGAQCFDLHGDFFCRCPDGFEGKDCGQLKSRCQNGLCEVIDSCTIQMPTSHPLKKGRRVTSNICGQHGICSSLPGGNFTCECQSGFRGRYCHENINDCERNPCQNSGTCVDGVNSYQCLCLPGWEGTNCTKVIDDCASKPCQNGGMCIDDVNDFKCVCVNGWKGKTCSSRNSQCDGVTCANGGTCSDLGNTFVCSCAPGYHGNHCQISSWHSCDSNPCSNGATCVNSGDSVTCLCKDGYEGNYCETDKNNCDPFPCYNGAQCIDGDNWSICECAKGFAGADCRININECASNPCSYGSTCIDGVASFRCICPPGRTGVKCDEVIVRIPAKTHCSFKTKFYSDKSLWYDECNSCKCTAGHVTCTKIWCGPANCLSHPNVSEPIAICQPDETCVVQTTQTCLVPPCLPWGQCRHVSRIEEATPRGMTTTCLPNMASLSNNCAKIDILFDRKRMPTGMSVGSVCRALRSLPQLHEAASSEYQIIILCAIHITKTDTIQVTLSTDTKSKEGSSNKMIPTLRKIVENLANAVSRKTINNSALQTVIDVQVEINLVTTSNKKESSYGPAIPVLYAIVTVLAVVSLVLIGLCCLRRRRRHRKRRRHHHHHHHHHHDCIHSRHSGERSPVARSNNRVDSVEEHLSIFQRNALFESDELRELNLTRYEKPSKQGLHRNNPVNESTPPPYPSTSIRTATQNQPQTPRVKMTNIEISQTLTSNNTNQNSASSVER